MERRDTSDLLSCAPHFHHVISASCLQLDLPPPLAWRIKQSVTGDGWSQPRKTPSPRQGPSLMPAHRVTCFWWREVCPSVWRDRNRAAFLQCQDFPESDLCDRESDRNADLTPPGSLSPGLLCVHTCTAKLRGWRGSRYNDLLSCDRWHLTSDLLYWQKYPVCVRDGGGMSVSLCSVVTCKMKANEEPDIFRMVSVNQGWHSHRHIWLKHSIQAVKGMKTHNKHCVRTVSKTHVKLIDYIGSIRSIYSHRQTMLYILIYNLMI